MEELARARKNAKVWYHSALSTLSTSLRYRKPTASSSNSKAAVPRMQNAKTLRNVFVNGAKT